jgi:hypothetical protein
MVEGRPQRTDAAVNQTGERTEHAYILVFGVTDAADRLPILSARRGGVALTPARRV